MSQRFFLESKQLTTDADARLVLVGTTIQLDGDQAHHAINVMRMKPGDEIVLFDGSGIEHIAKVGAVAKKTISVTVLESRDAERMVSSQLSIAVALPKGDRQKFLIEKLVELGVERLVPLKTSRSVAVANSKVIQRLRKQVVEACKQCGRNRLMKITESLSIAELVNYIEADGADCQRLLADPYSGRSIKEFASSERQRFVVAVGPEGGFDQKETLQLSENHFESMTLGPSILRIETACLAAASILGIGRQ